MNESVQTLLDLLAQFTGGRGGIDHVIVNYVIAGFFWAGLLAVASVRFRESRQPREALLIWGFGFALSRELFMITLALLQALHVVNSVSLHEFFPPLEHALHDLSLVVIGAAFLRYLMDDDVISRQYFIWESVSRWPAISPRFHGGRNTSEPIRLQNLAKPGPIGCSISTVPSWRWCLRSSCGGTQQAGYGTASSWPLFSSLSAP